MDSTSDTQTKVGLPGDSLDGPVRHIPVDDAMVYGLGLAIVADCYADRCCLRLAEVLAAAMEHMDECPLCESELLPATINTNRTEEGAKLLYNRRAVMCDGCKEIFLLPNVPDEVSLLASGMGDAASQSQKPN